MTIKGQRIETTVIHNKNVYLRTEFLNGLVTWDSFDSSCNLFSYIASESVNKELESEYQKIKQLSK